MEASTITRQPAGIPTGGQFASHDRAEAGIELTIGAGDELRDLPREEVSQLALGYIARIDEADAAIRGGLPLVDDGRVSGNRHAYAELVVRLHNPAGIDDVDAELLAEDLLNNRVRGVKIEDTAAFDPNGITATERAQLIDDLTRRADELFVEADNPALPGDVQAHSFGRFETISDAVAKLQEA